MRNEPKPFDFPCLEDQYVVCSDVYGHRIQVPGVDYDESFIEAVEDGYAHGQLHDNGHLVVDKATNKLAFLVTVRLEDDTRISAEKLAILSARYGVSVRLMAVPDGGIGLPAYQLVAAQLDRVEQFDIAYPLTVDITAAEEEARV